MHARHLTNAEDFLRRSEGFRSSEPYLTNVISRNAALIAEGVLTFDDVAFWTVEDGDGRVRGVMMRTAPYNLVVSPMPSACIKAAAAAVFNKIPKLPGVTGPLRVVEQFVEHYTNETPSRVNGRAEREVLVYVLGKLTMPPRTSGEKVVAKAEHFELLCDWWQAFGEDTDHEMYHVEETIHALIEDGRVHLWIVDGEPVCAVANSPVVETLDNTVVGIGPVYTPDAHRRHGYAGVLTAHVSAEHRHNDAELMLFTDAANLTSNGVYTRLGYELVSTTVEYQLDY